MPRPRPYSPYTTDAARLLGEQIRAARRERRWSQEELAARAGVTAETLRKVEHGNPSVALGTAFELATLVGVPLFYEHRTRLALELDRVAARSALLPQRVHARPRDVADDF